MRNKRHLLSYLAGVFDGEGCVSITKKKQRLDMYHAYYSIYLQVQMCDKEIPTLFQCVFGGSLSVHTYNGKGKENWRPKWSWSMSDRKTEEVMKDLLPYVILKRPQLEVALHFLDNRTLHTNKNGRYVRTSDEILALQEADYLLCRNLKGRILPRKEV